MSNHNSKERKSPVVIQVDNIARCISDACKGCMYEDMEWCEGRSKDWMKNHPEISLTYFSKEDWVKANKDEYEKQLNPKTK